MAGFTSWDFLLFVPAIYLAYMTLISLMRNRRDEVVRELEAEVAEQQRQRKQEEKRERQRRRQQEQRERIRILRAQRDELDQQHTDEDQLLQELDI